MILIGDVHGKFDRWGRMLEQFASQEKTTLTLGDIGMGFNEIYDQMILEQDHDLAVMNRVIGGNHDDYDVLAQLEMNLGHFGYIEEKDLFFIRGAASIDKKHRIPGVSWWENEELTDNQMRDLVALWEDTQPRYVVSHTCPMTVAHLMFGGAYPCRTGILMDELMRLWAPDKWWYGHMHMTWETRYEGTDFRCLDELECLEVPELGKW